LMERSFKLPLILDFIMFIISNEQIKLSNFQKR
jgi:hypothetical protein